MQSKHTDHLNLHGSRVEPTAFDIVIIGAGLSGIDAAWHLQKYCPNKSYIILESRDRIGGTWDLFRYPGIRSDSDMFTMGYGFRPWTDPMAISPGDKICQYIAGTAHDAGIDQRIRFRHKVLAADWSTAKGRWTITAAVGYEDGRAEKVLIEASFLFSCAGYYRYESGYTPEFPGQERFQGQLIHPQRWPEGLDYSGKRVVIIGSGATAVTLVPAMAKTAQLVTMLQRSPTYYITRPGKDWLANVARCLLPSKLAYWLARWRNIIFQRLLFTYARRHPDKVKRKLIGRVKKYLGQNYDVQTHFTPRYNPWEERLCLVPDGDFFYAIRDGRAEVVTDLIESFTEKGIQLKSGKHLPADMIVTATGLQMEILGGMSVRVDGAPVDFSKTITYKGIMYSGVPNLASIFGYINASWTLRADMICEYVCRLLNHMDSVQKQIVRPPIPGPSLPVRPLLDFQSGYIRRFIDRLPKHSFTPPWRQNQNYFADVRDLRKAPIDDGVIQFANPESIQNKP
jgi:monooxygenase